MTQVVLLNSGPQNFYLHRYVGPYKQAHWLRKHGYTVQVIDHIGKLDQTLLLEVLAQHLSQDTLLVGIATTFMDVSALTTGPSQRYSLPPNLIRALHWIRSQWPGVKIITGGHNSEIVDMPYVDASLQSYTVPPEDIILDLLDHIRDPKTYPEPAKRVYFTKQGETRFCYDTSSRGEYHIEQDDFQWQAQDCVLRGEPLPLDLSRGCIFKCRFCRYPHLGKRSHDYVRDWSWIEREVRENWERWGTDCYYILDDTFNDSPEKVKRLLELRQRLPFDFGWVGYLRADLIWSRPETAAWIQASGCRGAYFGLETLDPQASQRIGKGWSGRHARAWIPKLYHDIWQARVPIHCNFIVGLEPETEESVTSTAAWVRDEKIYSAAFYPLHLLRPSPGQPQPITSEFDRDLEKWGFRWLGREWVSPQWTLSRATAVAQSLNTVVGPDQQQNIWNIPQRRWSGYAEQTDSVWQFLRDRTQDYQQQLRNLEP